MEGVVTDHLKAQRLARKLDAAHKLLAADPQFAADVLKVLELDRPDDKHIIPADLAIPQFLRRVK